MKVVGFIITMIVIVIIGGALTAMIGDGGVESLLPFLQQTSNPSASTMEVEPWQAEQLILLIGFLLFNMIGIGATIALIMWLLHRQVAISRAGEAPASTTTTQES